MAVTFDRASTARPLVGPTPSPRSSSSGPAPDAGASPLTFQSVYDEHFDFMWRSVRRLAVTDDAVDDVLQEIFLVVLRRLPEFEGRSSMRTWLFSIAVGVVRNHLRTVRRKSPLSRASSAADPDVLEAPASTRPDACAESAEAVRLLHRLLAGLDEPKREAFILIELEQMSLGEASDALGVNVNTVASRLRAARQEFDKALARVRASKRHGAGA
jgi:RNA polymerase sigma-70 factor, ECF subfamily